MNIEEVHDNLQEIIVREIDKREDLTECQKDIFTRIVNTLDFKKLEFLAIFGSYAKGTYHQNSDVDIILETGDMDYFLDAYDDLRESLGKQISYMSLENALLGEDIELEIDYLEGSVILYDRENYTNIQKDSTLYKKYQKCKKKIRHL